MEDPRLVVDLVLALGAAVVGGIIARRLGQPVIIGYLLAGLVIGPNTPGFAADQERVSLLANLGVALLMFALGVEFSLVELRRVRRIAFVSAAIQIPLTIALGLLAGIIVGWTVPAALVLGGAFAISSTIVALKVLLGRGEADSPQARAGLGLGVVQDLSLVPMLAVLPILAGAGNEFGPALFRSLAISAVALIAVFVLGTRLVPPILELAAHTGSREVFLLTVVVIALGTAVAVEIVGLSLGLGAFLAGIVVSESEFESQVLADIIPVRDIFATIFFVSVGMLIDPWRLFAEWPLVLGLVVALVVGKLLITGGAFLAAGVDHRTATLAAILMAQMGEFSFILAGSGLEEGIIDGAQYGLILAVASSSIVLMPLLLGAAPMFVRIAEYLPGVERQERSAIGGELLPPPARMIDHVVLCGYGRVGAEVGAALEREGRPYAVIELNPALVRDLRGQGVYALYGDAASEGMLQRVGIERARTLAVATPDLVTAEAAIRTARRLNPSINVIARATSTGDVGMIGGAGADEVVQPEFEAGLEFVRQVLRWEGVADGETAGMLTRRREAVYRGTDGQIIGRAGGRSAALRTDDSLAEG